MPARASFITERYVRDHGVYTNWAEIAEDAPTYVWALRETGYRTAMLGKAHLYRDEIVAAAHIDDLAPKLQALGFSEVRETGDKFLPRIPTCYSDDFERPGLLGVYKDHIRREATRATRGAGRTPPRPFPCGTPPPCQFPSTPTSTPGTGAFRGLDRELRAA